MLYRYGNRDQRNLFPNMIEEYVSENDPVKILSSNLKYNKKFLKSLKLMLESDTPLNILNNNFLFLSIF